MTTAIATIHDPAESPFSSSGGFELAQRQAKALSQSDLMPKEYRGNLANCLIAIEVASRLRASPFLVAQNIDVIHGRPSWRASALIAMVNASGKFTPIRFRFVGQEGTPSWGCRAVAKDRETGEECVGTLITLQMAKAEGWATKNGSKWATMPELMLQYRAAAFWVRVYAPELSLGMSTAEEAHDMGPQLVRVEPAGGFKALEAKLVDEPATAYANELERAKAALGVDATPASAEPDEAEKAAILAAERAEAEADEGGWGRG